jgi:aspartate ammonia-lyase
MPGKVNPVIPEAVSQAAMLVMANDHAIAQACALGNLELNPFLPLIADCLLGSLDLLRSACGILRVHCISGLQANEARCLKNVEGATATVTALVEALGYEKAQGVVERANARNATIRQVVLEEGLLAAGEFDRLVSAENVTRLGSRQQEPQ